MSKIWKSAETEQYYLLPSELTWEDESEIAEYAVSEEAAQKQLSNALDDAVTGLKTAWNDFYTSRPAPPPPDPVAYEKGRAAVKDLLGVTADDIKTDESTGEQAIRNLFDGFKTFIQSVTEEDGSVARQQMANLQGKLEKHGMISAETDLTALPDALQESYKKTQEQRAKDFSELADIWDDAAVKVGEALRTYAEEGSDAPA